MKRLMFALAALCVVATLGRTARAGHDRAEAEAAVRQQYDWVVFDGEYSALSLLASIGFDVLTENTIQLTQQTALADAQQLGMDFAQQALAHGFNPAIDVIYAGTMTFRNWYDPAADSGIDLSGVFGGGAVVPLPPKWVPFLGVKRSQSIIPLPATTPIAKGTINIIYPELRGVHVSVVNNLPIPVSIVLWVITDKRPLGGVISSPTFGTLAPGVTHRFIVPLDWGHVSGGFDENHLYRAGIGLGVYKTPQHLPGDLLVHAGLDRNPSDHSLGNFLVIRPNVTGVDPVVPGGPSGVLVEYRIILQQTP